MGTQLLAEGRCRAIGVSNFDAADLSLLLAVATEPIAVNEAHFAVGVMDWETIALCREHNISLVSFSSLSAGVPISHPTVGAVAARHNATNGQVMLRYVSQHGISVLSSFTNPKYLDEDIGMFEISLSDQDMAELDALQTGKRTCPDCYTHQCQNCAQRLAQRGCPVGRLPVAHGVLGAASRLRRDEEERMNE